MTARFRRLIDLENAYLSFYMALIELPESEMQLDFREQNPRRYLDYLYWVILHEPKH